MFTIKVKSKDNKVNEIIDSDIPSHKIQAAISSTRNLIKLQTDNYELNGSSDVDLKNGIITVNIINKENKIQAGDKVKLKSEGWSNKNVMTVEFVDTDNNVDFAKCAWFNKHDEPQREVIAIEALKKVE